MNPINIGKILVEDLLLVGDSVLEVDPTEPETIPESSNLINFP